VDHAGEAVFGEGRQFLDSVKAFEHEDGLADAGGAQSDGAVELDQGEAIGAVGQRGGDAQQAVAVGIGLDDAPDARLAGMAAGDGMIVAQRRQVDAGADRTGHGVLLERDGGVQSWPELRRRIPSGAGSHIRRRP